MEYFRSKKRIEIDITYRCNLKCIGCNRSVSQAPTKDEMDIGQIDGFIEESIKDNIKWEQIRILGGEPTLHKDFKVIVERILRYKHNFSPDTIIEVVTNGYGKKVEAALKDIKKMELYIDNSYKDGNPLQRYFDNFNLAPTDTENNTETDYSLGCWVTEKCGIGLSPYGYYPCTVSAGIDRVFGFDAGRKKLLDEKDEMKDLLKMFCRLCGHFHNRHLSDLEKFEFRYDKQGLTSETWAKAYNNYKKNRPKLSRI